MIGIDPSSVAPKPTLPEAFCAHAARQPDALAFLRQESGERLTYGELLARARRVAAWLRAARPPDRKAAVLLPAGLDFPAAYLGCALAGVTAIPIVYPDPEQMDGVAGPLDHIVRDCGGRVVLTTRDVATRLACGDRRLACLDGLRVAPVETLLTGEDDGAASPTVSPSDPAHILYTSGSTSAAKGVVLSHGAVAHNLRYTSERWGFGAGDRHATFGSPYHSAGLMVGYLMPLFAGAASVLLAPETFATDPLVWLRAVAEHRVTHTACGNGAIDRLLARAAEMPGRRHDEIDLSAWRVAVIGGDPLHPATLDGLDRLCTQLGFAIERVVTAYGMTEAAGLITTGRRGRAPVRMLLDQRALGAGRAVAAVPGAPAVKVALGVGVPSHGVVVDIVDPDTRKPCPPGRVGEVWYASPSLFEGYLGADPPRELWALAGDDDARYLRSGDAGVLVQGELLILGRLKEIVRRGKRWFYPQEIEWVAEASDPALSGLCAMVLRAPRPEPDRAVGEEIVLAQEVRSGVAADPTQLDLLARAIHARLEATFGESVDRIVLVPARSLPWVYTSAKKPRLLAGARYRDGALRILHQSSRASLADERGRD